MENMSSISYDVFEKNFPEVIVYLNKITTVEDIKKYFQLFSDISNIARKFRVKFFTEKYCYTIYGKLPYDGSDEKSCLGAGSSNRKPLAGEDWTRGRDLPDGEFSLQTWILILIGVFKHEMIKLEPETKIKSEYKEEAITK